MVEQQETVIINVQVDAAAAAQNLADVTAEIQALKQRQKELQKEIAAGNDELGKNSEELAKNAQQIKLLTATQKSYAGQLQTTEQTAVTLTGSFREMDAQLRALENQYKSLTKAQRESAEGQALKKAIIEQKQAIKEFDAELGNHQRNVGNYPQAWANVIPGMDKVSGLFQSLGTDMSTMSAQGMKAFSGLGNQVKAFGEVFLTPPVAVIAIVVGAIVLALQELKEAFARNDAASTTLQAAFAKLQPIGDAIGLMFNKLADYVASLVDKMMKAYEWVIKFGNRLGIVSDEFVEATEKASDLVKSTDELEQMERDYTVNSAKRAKEVARLRNEASTTDDLKERMNMLQKAIDLESQTLADAQEIARKRLANLEYEAQKTGDTSDATADKIAQARAAMYKAEEAYYTGTRRLLREFKSAESEYIKDVSDRQELEAYVHDMLARFQQTKKAVEELRKPEPVAEEEIEEFIRPLTAYEEAIAELMQQGNTFGDAQKIIAKQTASAWADAAGSIAGAMGDSFTEISNLLGEYSEQSEEAAKAAKGFALVGIIASEAEAVANGVRAMTAAIAGATNAGAATGPAAVVTTPLFIAEMVGIVGGVIASTIANITQAKQLLSGAKFATGGIVGGTSYTGDRVPAMVNSGEMILTKEQQSRLFEIANAQGSAYGYETMRAAMTDALQAMPAPVMVYREFEQFGKQVATYKEIARV